MPKLIFIDCLNVCAVKNYTSLPTKKLAANSLTGLIASPNLPEAITAFNEPFRTRSTVTARAVAENRVMR